MAEKQGGRVFYLDALRALASFLVIVNHTNSYVFQASSPESLTWFLSMAWYYLSKMAVPLFVMISGALLLPRQDSYRRTGERILRMVGALLVFSYVYYLVGVGKNGWNWGRALDISGFLGSIWKERMTDSFWYLYFYIGLLFMLPILQKLRKGMERRDVLYLMGLTFGVNALWPLVSKYAPALALPKYVDVTMLNVFIGLFFAGHYVHAYMEPKPWHCWAALLGIAASVALAVWLTVLEYAPGERYWFMDERTAPSITMIACALCSMWLGKCLNEWAGRKESSRGVALIAMLGRCAFGVYLLQDLLTVETRYRIFEPLRHSIPPFAAALVWEVLVYGAAVAVSWGLNRAPGLRKLVA